MTAAIPYLVDTSAAARLLISDAYDLRWGLALENGLVAMCDLTELEMLYSARSRADRAAKQERLRSVFPRVPMPDDGVFARARRAQEVLTDHGEHRSAGPVDLLVAAVAELSGMTLLHHDRDFETVAAHTGQPTFWLDAEAAK